MSNLSGVTEELKRSVLDAADQVGLGAQLVRLYDEVTDLTDFEVDPQIRSYELDPAEAKGDVLLPVIEGDNRNAYRYYIFAHAFRTRGYRPIVPLCDADLDLCMRKSLDWDGPAVCNLCHHYGKEMAEAFGVETIPLGDLLPTAPGYDLDRFFPPEPQTYRGIDVSAFAQASVRKKVRRYHLDLDGGDRETFRRYLETSCQLVDAICDLFDRYEIEACLANDNAYVYGGVPLAVAHEHGIVGYSHKRGHRDETIQFGRTTNRSTLPPYEAMSVLEPMVDTPLSTDQESVVEEIMAGRKSGDTTRHKYSTTIEKSIDWDAADPVAGMFTNLIWDASLETAEAPYPDVFDWIADTIEWYLDNPDRRLVVKTHPAEAKRGTNESIEEWIHEKYSPLPDNVMVLSPETDVNTYELIEDLDVGLVYNSTVGMEMAYEGKPVVVAGETHYRDLGFTIEVDGPADYVSTLENLDSVRPPDDMAPRVRRYLYHYYVRKLIDFPYYSTDPDTFEIRLHPVSHAEITPGNESFDLIVDRVLAGEPILQPDIVDRGSDR
jgi:hypothetical protein